MAMGPGRQARPRPLGLRDLAGLVGGYALAGYLLRRGRPGGASGLAAQAAYGAAYLWFGLAMGGPIVLWLGRLGDGGRLPPRTPAKLGRLIAEVPVGAEPDGDDDGPGPGAPAPFSFNEHLWLAIGGFWAAIALFLPTPIGWDVSWAVVAAVPALAWAALGPWIVGSMAKGSADRSWTHPVASAVIVGWPFAAPLLWLGISGR